jgi:hypothetical protein
MAPTITHSPRPVKPGQLRASVKSRARGAEEEGAEGFPLRTTTKLAGSMRAIRGSLGKAGDDERIDRLASR